MTGGNKRIYLSITIETGQIAMDAKSQSDVKTLRGHIYGLTSILDRRITPYLGDLYKS